MSRLIKVIRSHHEINRTRRESNRAIANAATPTMRDERILVAQRDGKVSKETHSNGAYPMRPFVMSGSVCLVGISGGRELLRDVAAKLGQRRQQQN